VEVPKDISDLLAYMDEDVKGWTQIHKSDHVVARGGDYPGSKAIAVHFDIDFLPNVTPEQFLKAFTNMEIRKQWDEGWQNIEVREGDPNQSGFIFSFHIKIPGPMSNRDAIVRCCYLRDYPEQGTITISFMSVKRDYYPPSKKFTRADIFSGYQVKPSDRKTGCHVKVAVKNDLDIAGFLKGKARASMCQRMPESLFKAFPNLRSKGLL